MTSFEQNIGFLITDVARLLRRELDRRLRSLALTQVQWRAIGQLHREDGIRQATLADRLEVTPITLGRLIDRLEAAGWVRRVPDPCDRRAVLLYLTPKAAPILDEMAVRAKDALECALAGLAFADRRQLKAMLETIKSNLAAEEISVTRNLDEG